MKYSEYCSIYVTYNFTERKMLINASVLLPRGDKLVFYEFFRVKYLYDIKHNTPENFPAYFLSLYSVVLKIDRKIVNFVRKSI